MRIFSQLFLVFVFLLLSCKTEDKKVVKDENLVKVDSLEHITFVCPMECENGMKYYLEGKCDICHRNLIEQE